MQSLKKKTEGQSPTIASRDGGFTIIEVMIVLVIAAVIILIVFLAVPALQRNSRNNQRRNDASRIHSAVSEWRTGNQNRWPNQFIPPTTGNPDDRDEIVQIAGDLSFYNTNEVRVITGGSNIQPNQQIDNTVAPYAPPTAVTLLTRASCDSESNAINSGSSIVAIYWVETGGDFQGQCI